MTKNFVDASPMPSVCPRILNLMTDQATYELVRNRKQRQCSSKVERQRKAFVTAKNTKQSRSFSLLPDSWLYRIFALAPSLSLG